MVSRTAERIRSLSRTALSAASHGMVYPAALVAAGMARAEGSVIQVSGPVNHHAGGGGTYDPTPDIDLDVPWDIDGDSLADFILDSCGSAGITRVQILGGGIHGDNRIVMDSVGNTDWGITVTPITTAMTVGAADSFSEQDCGMITHDCNDSRLAQYERFSSNYPVPGGAAAQRDESLITGVFGFRFRNVGLGITNYGIAEFEGFVYADGGGTSAMFQINRWAYETSGGAISGDALNTAAVPEPSSLALLALGAAGVLYRQRKKLAA